MQCNTIHYIEYMRAVVCCALLIGNINIWIIMTIFDYTWLYYMWQCNRMYFFLTRIRRYRYGIWPPLQQNSSWVVHLFMDRSVPRTAANSCRRRWSTKHTRSKPWSHRNTSESTWTRRGPGNVMQCVALYFIQALHWRIPLPVAGAHAHDPDIPERLWKVWPAQVKQLLQPWL